MNKRFHCFVVGMVQGVGFRDYTQRQASSFGLTGLVRNIWDGQVEIEVEGPVKKLDGFFIAIEKGPSMSRVQKLEKKEIPVLGNKKNFVITN